MLLLNSTLMGNLYKLYGIFEISNRNGYGNHVHKSF